MKRSAGKIFIKGLIQSFFIVAILLGAGILGFKLTMHYWKAPQEDSIVAYQDETVPEHITKPSVDDISKNLIYSYDEKTNEIKQVVLEIFNCSKKKVTYITIPMQTRITVSDFLYHKLILVNPEFPQLLQLSAISEYLDTDTEFDYGELLIEDLLGLKISYYTAVPETIFDTMFESKTGKTVANTTTASPAKSAMPVEVFTKDYTKQLKKLKTQDDIQSYIEEVYPKIITNLPLEDKLKYLESYSLTKPSDVTYELIQGDDRNSGYIVNQEQAAVQFSKLTTQD